MAPGAPRAGPACRQLRPGRFRPARRLAARLLAPPAAPPRPSAPPVPPARPVPRLLLPLLARVLLLRVLAVLGGALPGQGLEPVHQRLAPAGPGRGDLVRDAVAAHLLVPPPRGLDRIAGRARLGRDLLAAAAAGRPPAVTAVLGLGQLHAGLDPLQDGQAPVGPRAGHGRRARPAADLRVASLTHPDPVQRGAHRLRRAGHGPGRRRSLSDHQGPSRRDVPPSMAGTADNAPDDTPESARKRPFRGT